MDGLVSKFLAAAEDVASKCKWPAAVQAGLEDCARAEQLFHNARLYPGHSDWTHYRTDAFRLSVLNEFAAVVRRDAYFRPLKDQMADYISSELTPDVRQALRASISAQGAKAFQKLCSLSNPSFMP